MIILNETRFKLNKSFKFLDWSSSLKMLAMGLNIFLKWLSLMAQNIDNQYLAKFVCHYLGADDIHRQLNWLIFI